MKKNHLILLLAAVAILPLVNGCATAKQSLLTVRTAVNQGFDFADKAVDTINNIKGASLAGTKDSVDTLVK